MSTKADPNKDLFTYAKSAIDKNVSDTNSNTNTINQVNLKAELLVGDGTGPSHLNPATGSNGNLLIKDNTTNLGVRWGTPQAQPIVQPAIVASATPTNLTAQQNNSLVVPTLAAGIVNLPVGPPMGTKFIISSDLSPGTPAVLLAPGSVFRSGNTNIATGINVSSDSRFETIYNSSLNQWIIFPMVGTITPAPP